MGDADGLGGFRGVLRGVTSWGQHEQKNRTVWPANSSNYFSRQPMCRQACALVWAEVLRMAGTHLLPAVHVTLITLQ